MPVIRLNLLAIPTTLLLDCFSVSSAFLDSDLFVLTVILFVACLESASASSLLIALSFVFFVSLDAFSSSSFMCSGETPSVYPAFCLSISSLNALLPIPKKVYKKLCNTFPLVFFFS